MSASSTDIPRIHGRYALYDAIASGGMATVHLGRLVGPVGFARTVAIKRLHPHLAADPELVGMLLDEARLVARIRHPNVVPTLDVVSEEGELFLVMEYVQGESLGRLLRLSSELGLHVPPDIAATLFTGVLHGLHAAHEARGEGGEPLGIVHRDVSPQNILIGIDGVPRVVDFGVAKAAGRMGEATRDGQLKGKLSYMSPEQLRGVVGRTTDVYAAAVVLWETLTGRRLFSGNNDAEIFTMLMEGKIEVPSTHVRGLPKILDAVTMRGLSHDPSKRYPTAREMARALEDGVPLVAPSKIGEWVVKVAGPGLAERARRIQAIESSSAMISQPRPIATNPSLSRSQLPPAPISTISSIESRRGFAPPSLRSDESRATQLSSGSTTSLRSKRRLRGWNLPIVAAGGVALVVVVAIVRAHSQELPTQTAQAAGAATLAQVHAPAPADSALAAKIARPQDPVWEVGDADLANTAPSASHATPTAPAPGKPAGPLPPVRPGAPRKDDAYDHM